VTPAKWKERLRKASFIRGDDARIVFYPHGPFKGYVLPRKEFEPIIVDSLARIVAMNIAILIAAVFVGAFVGAVSAMLTAVGFLEFLIYGARVRRLTKKLAAMPRGLSVRLYALKQDPEKLSQQLTSQVMMLGLMLAMGTGLQILGGLPFDLLLGGALGIVVMSRLVFATGSVWSLKRRLTREGSR
jgi:hypothetical protein